MSDPFLGLAQGQQMFNKMFYGPQLQQLDMLQKRAQINQALGLDPVSQSNIQAQQANVDLARQQEARLQEKQAQEAQLSQVNMLGALAFAGSSLPQDQQERFFSTVGQSLGISAEEITPEAIQSYSTLYQAMNPKQNQVGRYRQTVVGNNLITIDSVTGAQTATKFGPNVQAPEGLNPQEQKLFQSLTPEQQQKLISEQLDPATRIKNQDKAKQIEKADQFKKISVNLINKIENAKKLADVLGTIEGRVDFRLDSDEASIIADINELQDILTSTNLDLMTGVLSETDIQIIRNISSGGLNRTRSKKEFLSRIAQLRSVLSGQSPKTVTDETPPTIDFELPPGVERVE